MKASLISCLFRFIPVIILITLSNNSIFANDTHKAGDIVIESRTAKTPDGKTVDYELGKIYVPENREDKNSRLISVGFARLRKNSSGSNTPVFLLPGGPGESAITNFTDEDAGSRQRLANFIKYYNSVGDLVVVDQRGFTKYGEMLEFSTPAPAIDKPRSLAAETGLLIKAAKEAASKHPDADLKGYTIRQCAEDVNDLRKSLGYDKIILTGQSFGSQWSFAVMRLHPEIVERAQLSAVEPLDYAYDMPSHIFAALQRIARDADRDPKLVSYLPKGGMIEALRAVSERLKKDPVQIKLKNEKTGTTETVALGLEDFREGLLAPANELPAFIISLYHRHYEKWAHAVLENRKGAGSSQSLIGPLIDTSLGVSAERKKLLRSDPAADLLGFGAFESYIASAPYWSTQDMGDDFRLAVPSKIPVLFIHGDWDTSTPIENTLNILPFFLNSRAIIVHRGTHGARKAMLDEHPEVLEKLIEFLKSGSLQNLPVETSLPVPDFQRPEFSAQ